MGKTISKGGIVVFESTMYPRVTEEGCLPVVLCEGEYKHEGGENHPEPHEHREMDGAKKVMLTC